MDGAGGAGSALRGLTVLGCEIGEQLGRGASGTVYRARQVRLDREVAVKVVPTGAAAAGTEARFEREVRAVASLNHPHVVPLYDAGVEDGLLVLVMGLVDGDDLRRLVQTDGPLPPERAVEIIGQVGSALDAAHASGVVHRDVKPANVLLAHDSATWAGTAYLTDFGLARDVAASSERDVTAEGHWVGTPAYAAPEQLRGERVGPSSDLYALAGVLHFLLTGQNPDPDARHEGDDALLDVALRGMAARPRDRYPSAAAFVDAASRAVGPPTEPDATLATDQPAVTAPAAPAAPPPPPPPRDLPPRRGRRLLLALGAVLAVLVLAAGAVLAWRSLVADPGPERASGGAASATADDGSSPAGSSPAGSTGASPSGPRSGSPSGSPPGSPSGASDAAWPALGAGARGTTVTAAQHLLRDAGQDVAVDGRFGAPTRAAVRAFQTARDLDATGSLDDATWSRLTPRVARGDVNEAVRALQVLLDARGYDLAVDGRFGEETLVTVERYQSDQGLAVDGIVGPRTWQDLVAA